MKIDETQQDFVFAGDDSQCFTDCATPETGQFNVIPHLIILGLILFVLFSAIVVPKTLSFLQYASVTPPQIASSTTESLPAPPDSFANIVLKAKAVHVWDIAKQKTLFEKDADKPYPLASLTKLMTALVSYELVNDDTLVTISKSAAEQESGGWFMPGERYKAKQLADFALISSFNSAAYTLADTVGALLGPADPIDQFVSAMNIRADELSLSSLDFYNPTGLDISSTRSGGYGNASDINRLLEYIVTEYPEVLLPTITPHTRLYNTNGDYHDANNTNDIVKDIPNLLGSKTGYTDLAGGNLAIVFDAGFNHYIAVTILGSTRSERFIDMTNLVAAIESAISATPKQ